MNNFKLETPLVQSLEEFKEGEPRVYPLVQSTTYNYKDPDFVAGLFDLTESGHMYSRISNPTVQAFENKIAKLEGGVGAVAVSSGQAATTTAILNICNSGDHIVACSTIYGGTFTLLSSSLKKLDIEISFFGPDSTEDEILSLFKENTKAIFGETIGNPGLNVLDFEKISRVAKKAGVPFIVDNTIATPYLCRPIEHGANIVIHSTTKYIDGQGSCVGGVVVDAGNFDWNNGKFPSLVEPDPSYHGLSYYDTFKDAAYIVKARTHILRDFGATMSPFNAFIYLRGLETLHVRMDRHCENALKVAKFLESHENVLWVNYPKLKSGKYYELAEKYLPKGSSGIILFGIKGGAEGGRKFTTKLKWINNVVHLGDVRTCVLHPGSTTHRQLSDEEQIAAGVMPEAIRLNVGIENIDDIIADIDQALK
ncbi:MAG TPA: O-acetylhomoserine aminocarboxypropyltransferase/cysteine synthase [Tissierellia bacterium]|nr:O-acetylhomoserine aminocarboxypropyltransferase/cysteine synthase [Tissierellia bacterium]